VSSARTTELRHIVRQTVPVLVGQLAVMAFGVTDTIVAGRYSQQALAALSVGSAVYVSIFVALVGVLQVLLPEWAELNGAGRPEDLGRSVRQSLYLAAILTLAGFAVLYFCDPILDWTDVPVSLQGDVKAYLSILALALPATLLFRMYGSLNQSLHKPILVTWLQALALAVKVPLSIWFAHGGWGLEAHGAAGCAWATVLVYYLLFAGAFFLLRTQPIYLPYALWRRMERPDWQAIRHTLRLGVPAGLAVMVEVTSFTLMALFIARQGTTASAAHQIVTNLAALIYMIPLSIAIATSARVSYWLGAGDNVQARHAIRAGLRLAWAIAAVLSVTLALTRHGIVAIYTSNAQVAGLAATMLLWLALYQVADATQGVCIFILRCYRVAVAPLVAYCVLLWGAGLAGGYVLAYRGCGPIAPMNSPTAFWIMSTVALALLAIVLPLILRRTVRTWQPVKPLS
jgi:MATE family multidrug resistance protein